MTSTQPAPTDLSLKLQAGLEFHQKGQLSEAATIYEAILGAQPDHVDALHLLGVVAYQTNRHQLAADLIGKAIAINPGNATFYSNRGNALLELRQLQAAVESFDRAIAIRPDFAPTHSNRGVALKELKQLEAAVASFDKAIRINPGYADAYSNRGNALLELGRLDAAVASFDKAIGINPNYADACNNRGAALQKLNRPDAAVASYEQAIRIRPDYADACSNLGDVLASLGRLNEAGASYRRAIAINPGFAEAHNNQGNILARLGSLDEADASYQRAIECRPDFADAYHNRGNVLARLGRLDEASTSYSRAIQIKPDFAEAYNNLATVLNIQGKSNSALQTIQQSLQIGETAEARQIFVECIKRLRFNQEDSTIRTLLIRGLIEPWARPEQLVPAAISLIKLNPDLGACMARAVEAWPERPSARVLLGASGLSALAENALLCAVLGSAPIQDIGMERFLTMARWAMLEEASGATVPEPELAMGLGLDFCCALARQCFINEYVFSHTDGEIQKAGEVRNALEAALDTGAPVPVLQLIAVAAYFPLGSIPLARRLLEAQWPEAVMAVLVQQVREPAEEQQLRATIPRLTGIDDAVSLQVQDQYEANPYPRWVRAAPEVMQTTVVDYLGHKFPQAGLSREGSSGSIDLLIAGCGTGQYSIDTAQLFRNASVLAVDLSLHSLGYAKRKTHELGLTSIDFAQADILKLGSLDRRFDVIESTGVLHHLADPFVGWRVLLSILRPGGFMKLGFYSELARREIVRVREYISERGYGSSAEEIRRFRQEIMDSGKNADFRSVLNLADFYSISMCRDLLFHVQEHRLTLTRIETFLHENDLVFLGFDMASEVLLAYRRRFPDDPAATRLDQWQVFENENPDIFIGMYQFWIRKAE